MNTTTQTRNRVSLRLRTIVHKLHQTFCLHSDIAAMRVMAGLVWFECMCCDRRFMPEVS